MARVIIIKEIPLWRVELLNTNDDSAVWARDVKSKDRESALGIANREIRGTFYVPAPPIGGYQWRVTPLQPTGENHGQENVDGETESEAERVREGMERTEKEISQARKDSFSS